MSREITQSEKVAYWTTGYNYWKAKMGLNYPPEYGEPQSYEDSPCAGFYRKGVYEKVPDKRPKRVGWQPVAIFPDGEQLLAMVGNISVVPDKIVNLWTFVCGNPITEEWYRAVAERGEGWPDSHDAAPALPDEPQPPAEQSPAEKIAATVKADVALIAKYTAIDSDEMASKARSLQNKLLDSRSEAAKAYDAANRPLLDKQKALREVWFPIRDAADAGSKALATAMGGWEDKKRAFLKFAQEAADKAAREHAEAARKAEAANQPPPPPPAEVKPNVPAPSAQIRGGAGRAASVKLEKFVTEIDAEKVFQSFKTNAEVVELLTALAQKAIRAGLDVPGAKWEERSVVR